VGAAQVRRALADTDGVAASRGSPRWLSWSLAGGLCSLLLFSVWPWLPSLRELWP
jgi:hypothetical protein